MRLLDEGAEEGGGAREALQEKYKSGQGRSLSFSSRFVCLSRQYNILYNCGSERPKTC